jgi:uncharacterized protein (TIGR04551 family)
MLGHARPRLLALAGLSALSLTLSSAARAQTGAHVAVTPPAAAPPSGAAGSAVTPAPASALKGAVAPVAPPPVAPPPVAPPPARPDLMPSPSADAPTIPLVYAPATQPAPVPGIDPQKDQQQLAREGRDRPTDGSIGNSPDDVYSEDWWGKARPIFVLHGYFRTRGELYHNFSLGRSDVGGISGISGNEHLWPQPVDSSYQSTRANINQTVNLCAYNFQGSCTDKTESSANLRFRVEPEIHISDNLRIVSQIDLLDNLVLGSTPDSAAEVPGGTSSLTTAKGVVTSRGTPYVSAGYNGWAPAGAYATTQGPPTAGVNGYLNSVNVNRVWGEYMTPFGQLRFGRMPNQWGLGMVNNAGDGIDSDYQSTIDRIMFVSGLKPLDLYFGGSWDFVSSGATNATPYSVDGGQPTNICNLCNVAQWELFAAHKTAPEVQRYRLAHHKVVINGGIMATYREQFLDNIDGTNPLVGDYSPSSSPITNDALVRRDFYQFTPDLWFQGLYDKFRFEAEFASNWGSVGNTVGGGNSNSPLAQNGINIRQFGVLTESEFRAMEDKLHINFGFGWASGDPWVQGLNAGQVNTYGQQQELNGGAGPISTFSFNPDYRIDLILFRNILTRVSGAYYFRPSVDYDFLKNPNGQKFGGGAAVIWSRASEFEQSPGHARDLGVEIDLQLYYQAKDGTLNDDPSKLGGFYTMLQYGALFPLGGLDYLAGEQAAGTSVGANVSTSVAQTVRLFLGIAY